jgi:hypothetical protein
MKKILKIEALTYIILFGVCVFILLQSPLASYAKSIPATDSSIFIYAAQQILDGQLIYKDVIDIKGPFLYFIDAVALLIFNRNYIGIWIFELFSLFIASIMMYKIARFFAGRISSLLAVIAGMLFLVICLARGNMTEEWSLPYISAALYIFIDNLKENKPFTVVRLFILSLTFVLTFMLRANLVAVWAGFGIVLLIKWISEKRYKELIRNLSLILLFVALCLLPFFFYFYCKGTLSDAIYFVFKFNMFEYASRSNLLMSILITIYKISYIGMIIPVLIAIYMFFRNRTAVHGSILLALFFTLVASSLGHGFWHYYANFIPLLVIPYSYIFEIIKENISKRKYIFLFILFVAFNSLFVGRQLFLIYHNYWGENKEALKMEKLKEIIIQNTETKDKILVKGYRNEVYLYSGRTCATRFPQIQHQASLSKENYVKDAERTLPKLIIQDSADFGDSFKLDTLLNKKYQLIETIEDTEIWKLKE